MVMLCHQCYKDKPDYLIGKKTGKCRTCLYGERIKRYRRKHKAQISSYFKKWYEAHRGERKRQKNFPARNRKIYNLYMSPGKRYSMATLSRMFNVSPPRILKIIRQEEKKRKTTT